MILHTIRYLYPKLRVYTYNFRYASPWTYFCPYTVHGFYGITPWLALYGITPWLAFHGFTVSGVVSRIVVMLFHVPTTSVTDIPVFFRDFPYFLRFCVPFFFFEKRDFLVKKVRDFWTKIPKNPYVFFPKTGISAKVTGIFKKKGITESLTTARTHDVT